MQGDLIISPYSAPCKDCPEKGCGPKHATCEAYIAYRKAADEYNKKQGRAHRARGGNKRHVRQSAEIRSGKTRREGTLLMDQIKGAKYDEGKPRPSLVPVEGIEAIMHVREFGKAKYADAEDWRKVPREKWLDALLRHVLHIWDNPLALDYESGLPALWHVITNAAFLCAAYKDELQACQKEQL